MDESILKTTKQLLGIELSDTHFDPEILLNINSALMTLNQLGIGPPEGFVVSDDAATWDLFIGSDRKDLQGVKTHVYLKTKLAFDPPQMGYLVEAVKTQIQELEWRLNVQVDPDPMKKGGSQVD